MWAVWLSPSPAGLPPSFPTGIPEVSRFSCTKLSGVSWVYDYAGLTAGMVDRILTGSASRGRSPRRHAPRPRLLRHIPCRRPAHLRRPSRYLPNRPSPPTDRETECLLKTFAAHPAVFARARHGLLIRGLIDLLARGSARLRRSRAPLPHPPTLPRPPLKASPSSTIPWQPAPSKSTASSSTSALPSAAGEPERKHTTTKKPSGSPEGFFLFRATSYSPTHLRMQYHRG
jgi:hypothetical protein